MADSIEIETLEFDDDALQQLLDIEKSALQNRSVQNIRSPSFLGNITPSRPYPIFETPQRHSAHPSSLPFNSAHPSSLPFNSEELFDTNAEPTHVPLNREAAKIWIYPSNLPTRDYQLNIVRRALFRNTLAALPTGLGKTFIAAVVMLNYYRWFPSGQIIFMAPTRPLVSQQIQACHEIAGIPQQDMAQLMGSITPNIREIAWKERRVFFCTPQSLQKDIERGICDVKRFVCVIVDEAHRATGNYAYCTVINEIKRCNLYFRILALSATPGSTIEAVQQVVNNLLISCIEFRTENDWDVREFTHHRKLDIVRVKLSDALVAARNELYVLLEEPLKQLHRHKAFFMADPTKVSKFLLIQSRNEFRTKNHRDPALIGEVESNFAVAITLSDSLGRLVSHGVSGTLTMLEQFEQESQGKRITQIKRRILTHNSFRSLLSQLRRGLSSPLSSHPKMGKLEDVVVEHIKQFGSSTRIIIFTSFRESVGEIVKFLSIHPAIKATSFVGQAGSKGKAGKGQSQKEQQAVLNSFRSGDFNVLVATSIGEEGLDIGEVDLIVMYDATSSPTRMVQRMGRTGRQRAGRIVVLVTEGKEEHKFQQSQSASKKINRALLQQQERFKFYSSPRMIPKEHRTEMKKQEICIPESSESFSTVKIKPKTDPHPKDDWLAGMTQEEEDAQALNFLSQDFHALQIAAYIQNQTFLSPSFSVPHSKRSVSLVRLVRFIQDHNCGFPSDYTSDDETAGEMNCVNDQSDYSESKDIPQLGESSLRDKLPKYSLEMFRQAAMWYMDQKMIYNDEESKVCASSTENCISEEENNDTKCNKRKRSEGNKKRQKVKQNKVVDTEHLEKIRAAVLAEDPDFDCPTMPPIEKSKSKKKKSESNHRTSKNLPDKSSARSKVVNELDEERSNGDGLNGDPQMNQIEEKIEFTVSTAPQSNKPVNLLHRFRAGVWIENTTNSKTIEIESRKSIAQTYFEPVGNDSNIQRMVDVNLNDNTSSSPIADMIQIDNSSSSQEDTEYSQENGCATRNNSHYSQDYELDQYIVDAEIDSSKENRISVQNAQTIHDLSDVWMEFFPEPNHEQTTKVPLSTDKLFANSKLNPSFRTSALIQPPPILNRQSGQSPLVNQKLIPTLDNLTRIWADDANSHWSVLTHGCVDLKESLSSEIRDGIQYIDFKCQEQEIEQREQDFNSQIDSEKRQTVCEYSKSELSHNNDPPQCLKQDEYLNPKAELESLTKKVEAHSFTVEPLSVISHKQACQVNNSPKSQEKEYHSIEANRDSNLTKADCAIHLPCPFCSMHFATKQELRDHLRTSACLFIDDIQSSDSNSNPNPIDSSIQSFEKEQQNQNPNNSKQKHFMQEQPTQFIAQQPSYCTTNLNSTICPPNNLDTQMIDNTVYEKTTESTQRNDQLEQVVKDAFQTPLENSQGSKLHYSTQEKVEPNTTNTIPPLNVPSIDCLSMSPPVTKRKSKLMKITTPLSRAKETTQPLLLNLQINRTESQPICIPKTPSSESDASPFVKRVKSKLTNRFPLKKESVGTGKVQTPLKDNQQSHDSDEFSQMFEVCSQIQKTHEKNLKRIRKVCTHESNESSDDNLQNYNNEQNNAKRKISYGKSNTKGSRVEAQITQYSIDEASSDDFDDACRLEKKKSNSREGMNSKKQKITRECVNAFFEEEAEHSGSEVSLGDDEELEMGTQNSHDSFINDQTQYSAEKLPYHAAHLAFDSPLNDKVAKRMPLVAALMAEVNKKVRKQKKLESINDLEEEEEEEEESENETELVGPIHDGIQCDYCGVEPIVGIRHKCLSCSDYDLCDLCFIVKDDFHSPRHEFRQINNPTSSLTPTQTPLSSSGTSHKGTQASNASDSWEARKSKNLSAKRNLSCHMNTIGSTGRAFFENTLNTVNVATTTSTIVQNHPLSNSQPLSLQSGTVTPSKVLFRSSTDPSQNSNPHINCDSLKKQIADLEVVPNSSNPPIPEIPIKDFQDVKEVDSLASLHVIISTRQLQSQLSIQLRHHPLLHVNIHTMACGDYILSSRAVLIRCTQKDFEDEYIEGKLSSDISSLCVSFSKVFILIEKDPAYDRQITHRKFETAMVTASCDRDVCLLHCDDIQQAVTLIVDLVFAEAEAGHALTEDDVEKNDQHHTTKLQLLQQFPYISHTIARRLLLSTDSLADLMRCTSEGLLSYCPELTASQAFAIDNLFRKERFQKEKINEKFKRGQNL